MADDTTKDTGLVNVGGKPLPLSEQTKAADAAAHTAHLEAQAALQKENQIARIAAEKEYSDLIGKTVSEFEQIAKQQDKLIEKQQERIRLASLTEQDRADEAAHLDKILADSEGKNALSLAETQWVHERLLLLKGVTEEEKKQLGLQYKNLLAAQDLNSKQKEFSAGGKGILSSLLGIEDVSNSTAHKWGEMWGLSVEINEEGEKTGRNWKGLLLGLQAGSTYTAVFNKLLHNVAEKIEEVAMNAVSLTKQLSATEAKFRANTNASEEFVQQIRDGRNEFADLGATFDESSEAMQSLYEGYSDFSTLAANPAMRKELQGFSLTMTRMGVDSKTSAEHVQTVTKTLGGTAQEAIAMGKNFDILSQKIGVPLNTLMTGFQKAMPKLAIFGKKAEKVFTDLAVAAKATGTEVDQLLSITDQFDTFEGAAQKVGELNAILGTSYMSSIDMVMETDPTKRLMMIQKTVESSGKSWSTMGYYMKKAVASASGMDLSVAERVFRGGTASIEKWKEEQEKASKMARERQEISEKNIDIAKKLQTIWDNVAQGFVPLLTHMAGMLDWIMQFKPLVAALGGIMAGMWATSKVMAFAEAMKKITELTQAAKLAKQQETTVDAQNTAGKTANAAAGLWASSAMLGPLIGVAVALAAVASLMSSMGDSKSSISAHADGVTNFKGGVSIVGEKGPELLNLPRGSNVITNENTNKLAGAMAGGDGGSINYERLASAVAGAVKSAMQATATDKPIIIELNDREFGRAVKSSITKDSLNSRVEK
jgi:hypothetical protein